MFKSIWTYAVLAVPVLGIVLLIYGPTRQMAGGGMMQTDTSAIPQGDALADVVLPASFSENAQIGKNAFEASCAACHGINAAGQNSVAPPLVHRIYEPSHHGDQAFWNAAQNGVRAHHWNFGNMPPVEGLSRADVVYIVAYVRELQQANDIN